MFESYEIRTCIMVSAPSWFMREDFQNWRNNDPISVATWNKGKAIGDFLDVFLNYETNKYGCDSDWGETLPEDIKESLLGILKNLPPSHKYGVIWIKPV